MLEGEDNAIKFFRRSKKLGSMSSLRGPSVYEAEPTRSPLLIINSKEPFNAETPSPILASSFITSEEMFYKRNHGPIPVLEDPSTYRLEVAGLVSNSLSLSLDDIKRFPKHVVVATLQCAGNRRTAMSKMKTVKGVGWGISAVGNGVWGGARLSDVLNQSGIPACSSISDRGGMHVEFTSVDVCKEEKGGPYKASVPLLQATTPASEILLAYEMNGQELSRDHGYPLRVVIPGVIGARSVKWLASICVTKEECQGFFMQLDYKMFPPTVDWDNVSWPSRRPVMDFPVQCAICTPEAGASLVSGSMVTVRGYALSGGGRGIERVDVTVDGGKTWLEAKRYQDDPTMPYISDDPCAAKWAWVLWELVVKVQTPTVIIAKAVDSSSNVQPEDVSDIWNLRGVLNNSWHKIDINAVSKL